MPARSEEHMLARRQQILEAASRVFAKKGIHQSSIRDICFESGLSVGAVYGHFENKREIVLGFAQMSMESLPPMKFQSLEQLKEYCIHQIIDDSEQIRIGLNVELQILEESQRDTEMKKILVDGVGNQDTRYSQSLNRFCELGVLNDQYDVDAGARVLTSLVLTGHIHRNLGYSTDSHVKAIEREFERMVNS